MFNNKTLKGVFLVATGATSFGMLATFVKMAYEEGAGMLLIILAIAIMNINFKKIKKTAS